MDKFGSSYFDLSQLTRISPKTYRALAPAKQFNERMGAPKARRKAGHSTSYFLLWSAG